MKWGTFVLALYLLDEILSRYLPLSSGLFAISIICLVPARKIPLLSRAQFQKLCIAFGLCLVTGLVGGVLSGTPIGGFFLVTLLLLGGLASAGMRLSTERCLISPSKAFSGLVVSVVFLFMSVVLGFDAFRILTGSVVHRGVGIFAEPSHLALYLTPLFIIAWAMPRRRPWLVVMGLLTVLMAFSLTLVLCLLLAILLVGRFGQTGSRKRKGAGGYLGMIAGMTALVVALPLLPISIGGVPVGEYVSARLDSLSAGDDTENHNASGLVVLQGVQLATDSFNASRSLGVGAGNFGTSATVLEGNVYRDLINAITAGNGDLNLRDGAILINKVVGEFGIFAVLILWGLLTALRRVKQIQRPSINLYHLAFLCSAISLLFFRALPYFSAPGSLAILSLAALCLRPTQRVKPMPVATSSERPLNEPSL